MQDMLSSFCNKAGVWTCVSKQTKPIVVQSGVSFVELKGNW